VLCEDEAARPFIALTLLSSDAACRFLGPMNRLQRESPRPPAISNSPPAARPLIYTTTRDRTRRYFELQMFSLVRECGHRELREGIQSSGLVMHAFVAEQPGSPMVIWRKPSHIIMKERRNGTASAAPATNWTMRAMADPARQDDHPSPTSI